MLFSFLSPITLAILSETSPQGPGIAANTGGVAGQHLQEPQGGTATDLIGAGGNGGVDPNAQPGGQPSPQLANIPIEDARFYVPDPARPDQRFMGLQLREALHRGLQVDELQSQLHTTQNQNRTLLTRAEAAEARLAQIDREREVASTLANMGITSTPQAGTQNIPQRSVNPVDPTQITGVQQAPLQGTVDPALDALSQQWGSDGDTAAAFGLQQGNTQPNTMIVTDPNTGQQVVVANPGVGQPDSQPVANTQNQIPLDPQAFARSLLPVLDQLVERRVSGMQQTLNQANQQGMQQIRQEWANKDQISSTFDEARNMRSQGLLNQGLSKEEVNNILDLEDMSRVLERQAEGLINQGHIQIAREKLAQSGNLTQQAITARTIAQRNYENSLAIQNFESQIETDPFAAMGVQAPDDSTLPPDLKDPQAIQKAIQGNFNIAAKMVEERDRIERTAGVM